jgi:hypothetical protein
MGSMRAGRAPQRGHARGDIAGHGQDAAEAREVEDFAHTRLRTHQHESPIGILGHGGVDGDEESDGRGANGYHVAEVNQDFRASLALELIQPGSHVFGVGAGHETALAAHDADVVDLIELDEHFFLAQGLWYRTTLNGFA